MLESVSRTINPTVSYLLRLIILIKDLGILERFETVKPECGLISDTLLSRLVLGKSRYDSSVLWRLVFMMLSRSIGMDS